MIVKCLCMAAAVAALPFIAAAQAEQAPLIPRAQIFGNPERAYVQISPDGNWLSWLAPVDGVLNIWLAPASEPERARPLTDEKHRPLSDYFWAPDSSSILYIADNAGDENYVLYKSVVSASATGPVRPQRLTPEKGTRVQVVGINSTVKDRLLIGLNHRDARAFDVFSLDIASGALTEVFYNRLGYVNFLVDSNLNIRLVSGDTENGDTALYRVNGDSVENRPFKTIARADVATTKPLGFSRDGTLLYWLDSGGRDTSALVAENLTTRQTRVLGEDNKADVSDFHVNPATGELMGYAVEHHKTRWTALTPEFQADLDYLGRTLSGQFHVTSATADNSRWIVFVESPTVAGTTYLYDRTQHSLKALFVSQPALATAPLASMHTRTIVTRDALALVAYLTLPPWEDHKGVGVPEKPLPMVLLVHGGPWSRDSYGFNAQHQWLANRGYAVLSVNFRGSTGFGKRFLAAGDQQWGANMQDDLLDAVDWAVRNGIARQDRVAIMGQSYGGYATLRGLTQTPERFACGIDVVGPANLLTLLETLPPYWEGDRSMFYERVGDPTTEAGQLLLRERSPLFSAAAIRRPLLIAQGANDPRVNQAESDQIVQAMAERSIPVTYLLFPDEGHGFNRPENELAFSAVAEAFLGSCLGGRAEPWGDTLKASSITVPHGQAFVPGLEEALNGR